MNALYRYKARNPRRPHIKFREAFVYEMTQPLFDKREQEEATRNADLPETCGTCRSVVSTTRLKGKHYSTKHIKRRRCSVCAYQVNPEIEI